MKEIFNKLKKKQKFSVIFISIYSIINSLFFSENIGYISIAVLVFYLIVNIRLANTFKLSFLLSLLLICLAVVMYIFDIGNTWSVSIKKLAEWTYLLLLVGVLQLTIPEKLHSKM